MIMLWPWEESLHNHVAKVKRYFKIVLYNTLHIHSVLLTSHIWRFDMLWCDAIILWMIRRDKWWMLRSWAIKASCCCLLRWLLYDLDRDSCMQTHSHAFKDYKQEEILHLQPINWDAQTCQGCQCPSQKHQCNMYTVANTQLLFGAVCLQIQRLQPRMKGLQCISFALMLAEGHAKSQVHCHTSFACCDPCGFIWQTCNADHTQ